jgi:hypothetical protein
MASFRSLSPAAQAADNAARQARIKADAGMRRSGGAGRGANPAPGSPGFNPEGPGYVNPGGSRYTIDPRTGVRTNYPLLPGDPGYKGGGANPPGRGAGGGVQGVGDQGGKAQAYGRVDQLRQAIQQQKMPPPLTPPTTTNGKVGSAPGGPTPVSGGETAFNGPTAAGQTAFGAPPTGAGGSGIDPSAGLLAMAAQTAGQLGGMTQFQGPQSQQGAMSGAGGSGPAGNPGGLAGMMGSMGPASAAGQPFFPFFNRAMPLPAQAAGGGGGSGGSGGPLPPPGEGGGGWQAPGGGGGPMPWLGGGFHTTPQPIGTLPGAPGYPGWGQGGGGGLISRPTVPTTNLGQIGNPPRVNPSGPGGLHPSLGGFGSGMM